MVCSLLHFFRFVAVPGTLFVDISSLARAIVAVSFLVFLQIGMLLFMVAICMRTILKVDLIDHKPFGSHFSKTSTETAFFTVLGGGVYSTLS
jgi:hypothetical protein